MTDKPIFDWRSLKAGGFRHPDPRLEWTRPEFNAWAECAAKAYLYTVEVGRVGPDAPNQPASLRREA